MSSGDHGAIKVERCIYRRQNGRYAAKCWQGGRGGRPINATFDTLKEARAFRDKIAKKVPRRMANGRKIDWNVTGVSRIGGTGYIPDDVADHRKTLRQQIQSAPKSTVYRDGKKFTLIELPEVLT